MAGLNFNFNAAEVDTSSDFDPLPAGWYNVVVDDSDVCDTKAGTGTYAKLKMRVIDGPSANRVVFANITITNPSQTAVEIGQKQLAKICQAVGLSSINDTALLHNKPFQVRLTVKSDDQYGDSNDVQDFKPVAGAAPAVAPVQTQEAPAANTGGSAPPWNQ